MKVTPVASPQDVKQAPATDLRAKAIEAFKTGTSSHDKLEAPAPTTGQAQEFPVVSPNKVAAEEMTAIKARTLETAADPEVQAPAPDSTPNEVDATPAKDPAVSRLYAQLARQERALRSRAQTQEQQFKQREAAIQAREAEAQQKSEINQKGFISMERLKNDPLGALQDAGVAYDEVAQQLINPTQVDPRIKSTIDALKAEIADLKKTTAEGREEINKQQQASYNAAVKQIETDTRNLVSTDPNFELVKATGAVKDVVKLITSTYEKEGILLTVEEAAQEVEDYLVEKTMKLTKLQKIQRSQRPQTTNAASAQKTAQTAATTGQDSAPTMKTLTNAASSTRKLSARERAILAFKGESRS
jgi:hypothetical protein